MIDRESLERLRDLFYSEPSSFVWLQVISVLDRVDEEGMKAIAIDYASSQLEGWPVLLRAAPRWWWSPQLAGEDVPGWRLVRGVDLSDDDHKGVDGRAFLKSHHMATLEGLVMRRAGLGGGALRSLFNDARLEALEALDLTGNGLRSQRDVEYLDHVSLPALRCLHLSENSVSVGGFAALAGAGLLVGLEELVLSRNVVTRDGLEPLWRSPALAALRTLDLRRASLNAGAVFALVTSEGPPILERLVLSENNLGSGGLRALAEAPVLGHLKALDLSTNRIYWRDLRAWTRKLKTGVALKTINLSNNPIEDRGLEHLIGWGGAEELERLELSGARITASGAEALVKAPWFARLRWLDVSENGLPSDVIASLKEAMGAGAVLVQ